MNYTELSIELPEYLKKYITFETGGFIYVSKKSRFGQFILGMLRDRQPGSCKPKPVNPGPGVVILRIPDRYTREASSGKYLRPEAMENLKRSIRTMFLKDLRDYIAEQKLRYDCPEKDSMRIFRDRYGIHEDDFTEESMYRDYVRWKASKKIA